MTDVDTQRIMDWDNVQHPEIEETFRDMSGILQRPRIACSSAKSLSDSLARVFTMEPLLHTFGIPAAAPYKIDVRIHYDYNVPRINEC